MPADPTIDLFLLPSFLPHSMPVADSRLAIDCEVCVGRTAESGPVFPHRWGCINTGGRGRKSTWGHTHTVLCVCVLTLGKVSQTKNGREFLFDSTGNPRRVCPGMRTALEAGRNREK